MPWSMILLDLLCVLVFAAIGRRSHTEGLELPLILRTASPFMAGSLLGSALIATLGLHTSFWKSWTVALVSTVAAGMIIRVLTGAGTALSFIIVSTVFFALAFALVRAILKWADKRQAPGSQRKKAGNPGL